MLQVICIITMFLDHLGLLFSVPVLRLIGRVSMPIYAYLLSVSVNKTHDLEKFSFKLGILAFISQIPYYIFTGEHRANIIVTWFLCVYFVVVHRSKWKKLYKFVSYFLGVCLLFGGLKYDYGYIAILWFIFFYSVFQKTNKRGFIFLVVIAFLYIILGWYLDLFAFVAFPVVLIGRKYKLERVKNVTFHRIYQYFYPGHLAFLSIFKCLLGGSV